MSKNRNLADLLDSTGDVKSDALDNVSGLPDAIDVNASAPADSLNIDASGNVGIGTTNPDSPIEISGSFSNSNGTVLKLASTHAYGQLPLDWEVNGTLRGRVRADYVGNMQYVVNGGNHYFYTGGDSGSGTVRAVIDSNGQVGISNTSPNATLHVGGTREPICYFHQENSNDVSGIVMRHARGLSGYSGQMVAFLRNDGTTVGQIRIGVSSTSYNTSSDYRLKENVVDMTGAIDRVKALQPKRFNFIADEDDTTVDGFLAHEVSDVIPEAISGEKDATKEEEYEVTPAVLDDDGNVVTEAVMGTRTVPDYQGIDQSKLVPLLTGALQEAIAKIEALETRIEALENA